MEDEQYPCPDSPGEFVSGPVEGKIIHVGVFIMPGNGNEGAMETMLVDSVAGEPAMDCVGAYFECLDKNGCVHTSRSRRDKARAHAFIASQEHPDVHPGIAAKKGYWNLCSDALDPLKDFIQRLADAG